MPRIPRRKKGDWYNNEYRTGLTRGKPVVQRGYVDVGTSKNVARATKKAADTWKGMADTRKAAVKKTAKKVAKGTTQRATKAAKTYANLAPKKRKQISKKVGTALKNTGTALKGAEARYAERTGHKAKKGKRRTWSRAR